ncbi:uncharacterized protein LOC144108216 [Amblyomma americanum]
MQAITQATLKKIQYGVMSWLKNCSTRIKSATKRDQTGWFPIYGTHMLPAAPGSCPSVRAGSVEWGWITRSPIAQGVGKQKVLNADTYERARQKHRTPMTWQHHLIKTKFMGSGGIGSLAAVHQAGTEGGIKDLP